MQSFKTEKKEVLTWNGIQVTPDVGIYNLSWDISPHQDAASLAIDEEEWSSELWIGVCQAGC